MITATNECVTPPARSAHSGERGIDREREGSEDAAVNTVSTPPTFTGQGECALFSVSSPRRLGESLRSAASSHFPGAIERIVRESSQRSLSQSKRGVSLNDSEADRCSEAASEDHHSATLLSDGGTLPSSSTMLARHERQQTPTSVFTGQCDGGSSDSFAQTASFSSVHNASIAPTSAPAPATVPRKKSFFASLLEPSPAPLSQAAVSVPATSSGNAKASIPTVAAPSALDAPRKSFRCKLTLFGESGSGKTTFQRCVTQSVLRTLPDVTPSISSSSSLYYYRSTTRREKLDMLLVDAGPDPLATLWGLGSVIEQSNCFALVLSLAGVKQRTSKKFLSFGNEPSAIVHARDKAMIRAHVAAICATMDIVSSQRPPRLVVIGTHKDFLTDQSREAVETVLREVNRVVAEVLQEFPMPPQSIGCFAISCQDHTCVPENRGGPRSISELWNFLCDICLKDATLGRSKALVGEPPIRWEELSEKMSFEGPEDSGGSSSPLLPSPGGFLWLFTRSVGADSNDVDQPPRMVPSSSRASSPIPITVRNAELSSITDRVVTFVRRAKTELNFVVVHTRALRQVAFSLGVFSQDHFDAIMRMLSRDGEILLLDHQPHHVGGREDSVVLWPHLAHRAVAALAKYHSTSGHWIATSLGGTHNPSSIPGVDTEECRKADLERRSLTHGIFSPGLIVALSRSLPQTRRPVVERAETFALLLLLSDYVFQRRCRVASTKPVTPQCAAPLPLSHQDQAITPQRTPTTSHPPVEVDDVDVFPLKSPPVTSRNASIIIPTMGSTDGCGEFLDSATCIRWGVEYVAPSLVQHTLPANIKPFFSKTLQAASDHSQLLLGAFAAKTIRRTLRVPRCPPHVLHRMMCRWSPFIVPTSLVYADAVYLRRVSDSECAHDDDPDEQHMMQSGRVSENQRHTRCLVFSELESKDDACAVGPSTALSGTLRVHLVVVSSEDLIVVAHFMNTLLRAACQLLDHNFPSLQWSVEGTPASDGDARQQLQGPENLPPDVFLDVPSVAVLDSMFCDPSVPQADLPFLDAEIEAAAALLGA